MEYNNKHAHLEAMQTELLNQILGFTTVTYTDTEVHEHGLPTIPVTVNNERNDLSFEDITYSYKVLSCNEKSAKFEYDHPTGGQSKIKVSFIGQNTYWISSKMLPFSREYFVRVTN